MTEATQKAPGQPVAERETRSQWRDVWDQFTKHKGALIGGILFFAIVFAVMLGPSLWPYEANEINIRLRNQNPSWAHPFGTCLLYTSPSPRDRQKSRMPSSA